MIYARYLLLVFLGLAGLALPKPSHAKEIAHGLLLCKATRFERYLAENPSERPEINIWLAEHLWASDAFSDDINQMVTIMAERWGGKLGRFTSETAHGELYDSLKFGAANAYLIYDQNIQFRDYDDRTKVVGDWIQKTRNAGRTGDCIILKKLSVCSGELGQLKPCEETPSPVAKAAPVLASQSCDAPFDEAGWSRYYDCNCLSNRLEKETVIRPAGTHVSTILMDLSNVCRSQTITKETVFDECMSIPSGPELVQKAQCGCVADKVSIAWANTGAGMISQRDLMYHRTNALVQCTGG